MARHTACISSNEFNSAENICVIRHSPSLTIKIGFLTIGIEMQINRDFLEFRRVR